MNMYADDTAIYVCGTDLKEIQKRLQEEVDKVVKWFNMNRLLINNLKSCCMIISSCPIQKTLDGSGNTKLGQWLILRVVMCELILSIFIFISPP